MSTTNKKLCKWSEKTIKKNIEQIEQIVGKSNYYCKNCMRTAKKGKWLCKSIELKKVEDET